MDVEVDPVSRAGSLVSLFCPTAGEFGQFSRIDSGDVPPLPRQLLDHRGHMTVTMEQQHGCLLELRVVAERDESSVGTAGRYAREILLATPAGRAVQYGIVRIDLRAVEPVVAESIRSRRAPLGRILVQAGLLCEVQNVALVRVSPGPHLRRVFPDAGQHTYGRVAEIVVAGRPMIELLEIVPADA
ncbi:MAG: hypothetical protein ACR2IT_00355 [Pirellulales bacterium]